MHSPRHQRPKGAWVNPPKCSIVRNRKVSHAKEISRWQSDYSIDAAYYYSNLL